MADELSQWWDEDADRLNKLAEAARQFAAKVPYQASTKNSRAFCPTGVGGGVDNTCSPGKGGGGKGGGSKGGSKGGGGGKSGKAKATVENSDKPKAKKAKAGKSADVSSPALKRHADKFAGGSRVDPSLTTKEFPDGAVVPNDLVKLQAHHSDTKRSLAERIGVPSVKASGQANGATTVDELLADAREVAPAFKQAMDRVAEEAGVEISFGEADPKNPSHDYLREYGFGSHMLKLPESLGPKVGRVRDEKGYGSDVPDSVIVQSELKDAVRGTLIADTPEALGDAVRSVQEQAKRDGLAVSIKNRFEDSDKTGYAAVHMTLQMKTPSGKPVMTEVQFHLRQAYDGNQGSPKENSHGLYKPAPNSKEPSPESTAAQMLIWSTALDQVPPPPRGRGKRSIGRWPGGSPRAFCPGASPPDNSCSPANKGNAGPVGPNPPEPAWDASTVSGHRDARGALSGHNSKQRKEYADKAVTWMAGRGVRLTIKDDGAGPPTVAAIESAVRGVEALERTGIDRPEEIVVENIRNNAPAVFGFEDRVFVIDPDLDMLRIGAAIDNGTLVGDPQRPADSVMIHETAHRDHGDAIRREVEAAGGDTNAAYIKKLQSLLGLHMSTPTAENDPWGPGMRMRSTARANGKAIDAGTARQLAASVSRYATTNPMEFVAEVRTGMALGKTYPKPVMDLFDDYLGPRLSPAKTKKAA